VALERGLDNSSLDALAAAMNQAHITQAGGGRRRHVFLDN
jgi:hypothetical protein